MHYGEIKSRDIANGIGVRVTLFVSGCTNRCENCFQPQTWDFEYGSPFTKETESMILDMLEPEYVDGLTLLGGEPMEPSNQQTLYPFLKRIKDRYPDKTIWVFSGCTLEELCDTEFRSHCDVTCDILKIIDVLVDGRYVDSLKDITLRFRGSSNQRIIDMKQTIEQNQVVLWKG